ncbi:hypothetical protein PYCCODRAFT_1433146 [Trametes coccinea BRFM310]|uniref:J domain-containing protein n=1 Tax=Trametes coccinea (strain BRFM310) TaxID=1353009 RepID=A0A1Y2IUN9_TRAC3|nr:hypothetical protein PYCCODRAFT_1433146 [Trametes coccinea BRFM310]
MQGACQLALALHPDKNGAPGADEAFKSECYHCTSSAVPAHSSCSGIKGVPGSVR